MSDPVDSEEPPPKRLRLTSDPPPIKISPKKVDQTEREKEHQVGIRAFVNPNTKTFVASLKTRYTDFLVNEVLPNGQVVHLRDISAPKTNEPENASEQKNGDTRKSQHSPTSLSEITEEQKLRLGELLNPKAASEICSLYDALRDSKPLKPVKTEFTSDRTLRGEIHQFIRATFHSAIDSTTEQDGTLVLNAIHRRGKSKNTRNNNRPNWSDGGYLHFTLYKENKDTMEVVSRLAKQLKTNAKTFQFAGTKDRRAVTSQRCSAYHVEAARLAAQNRQLWGAKIGDFAYHKQGLELGDLSGNEFTITLRNLDAGVDTVDSLQAVLVAGMQSLRDHGYLNYFGQQRFGTFSVRTDDIGKQILKENYKAAIDAILSFPAQALVAEDVGRDDRDRARAISKWRSDNKLNEALDILPRKFSAEASILRHLTKQPTDFLGALLTVQRNLRLMYVHAYQSLVWNLAASHRIQTYGNEVVAGDLVLIKEHNLTVHEQIETVDADGEQVIVPSGNDRAVDKDDVFERARALTEEEATSGRFNMFDIVLPQPGYDVEYPENETGQFFEKYMKSVEGGELDPRNMRRKQRDFSLSGAYRKVLARIGDGWEIKVHDYIKDDEQFVQTDLERINAADGGKANESKSDITAELGTKKMAAVLKFQLGTSQYATMALRELSKGGVVGHKADFSGGR